MSAGVYNITIDKGNSWDMDIIIKDEYGNFADLTGFTGVCKIKRRATDTTSLAEPTVTINQVKSYAKISLTKPQVTVNLTKTQSLSLPTTGATYKDKSVFYYDLYIFHDTYGISTRIMNGSFQVSPDIAL